MTIPRYLIAQLDETDPTPCPCGTARRAFALPDNNTASVHVVDIKQDARSHHHKDHTEIYVILEGQGHLELDGAAIPVRPLLSALIRPGCRHRAVVGETGRMRILNIVIPPFDPKDEWFD